MTRQQRLGLALFCVLLISPSWRGLVQAQVQDSRWSTPYRLSSAQGEASDAALIADQYGYVHAFWREQGLPDNRSIIQYARFNGDTWSGPVHIHVTSPGLSVGEAGMPLRGFLTTSIDQKGTLHLAWTERKTSFFARLLDRIQRGNRRIVFYSSAPAHDGLSAQHWQEPLRIDISPFKINLQVDTSGIFHIVYSRFYGEERGVYYVRSEDQGKTWSDPRWLDPDIPPRYAPLGLQVARDKADGLHVVWSYVDPDAPTVPEKWIRYAHSLDGGKSWSLPITIDEEDEESGELRMARPILTVQGGTVHIIWAGDRKTHREHRFSTDAGRTWSSSKRIFGDLHGQASDGITVDPTGRVHFIGQIRYEELQVRPASVEKRCSR